MERLSVRSEKRIQFIPMARLVRDAAEGMGVRNGTLLLYVPHTTAGIIINEGYDPDVMLDLDAALRRAVPDDGGYRHGEGNSPAHVKAALVGQQLLVPVEDGRLALGQWQEIFFAEFDGPRSRQVWVQSLA